MTARINRIARTIVGFYPRAWRDRYEDEVLALVDASPAGVGTAVDLLAGAGRERLIQFALAYDGRARSTRSIALAAGSRVALISVGSLLSIACALMLPLASLKPAAFEIFLGGVGLLTIRVAWLGWRQHRSQASIANNRALLESVAWCVAAVLLGALYQSAVGPVHGGFRATLDVLVGAKGVRFMLAAECLLRAIASPDRPGARARR
jgi:hypothetical protein